MMRNFMCGGAVLILLACTPREPEKDDPVVDAGVDFGPMSLVLHGPTAPVRGWVTIHAQPTTPEVIREVVFRLDDEPNPFDTDITPPFSTSLNGMELTDGAHQVHATAHRADGINAESSLTITVDKTGPGAQVMAPEPDARVLPPGNVTVTLTATDPSTVAHAWVGIDQGLEQSIPVPQLSLQVTLPAAVLLPEAHALQWRVEDAAGNQTHGTIPVLLTRELMRVETALDGHLTMLAQPQERTVLVQDHGLASYSGKGLKEWSLEWSEEGVVTSLAGNQGATYVGLLKEADPSGIHLEQISATGQTNWRVPGESSVYLSFGYDAASDTLWGSRAAVPLGNDQTGQVVKVNGNGQEQVFITLDEHHVGSKLVMTYPGVLPPALAVYMSPTQQGGASRMGVWSMSGEKLWSTVQFNTLELRGLFLLNHETVMMVVAHPATGMPVAHGVNASGVAWSVESDPADELKSGWVMPGGDVILSSTLGGWKAHLRRLQADGTVVFDKVFDYSLQALRRAGDDVVVCLGQEVHRLDRQGNLVTRFQKPEGFGPMDSVLLLFAEGLADGRMVVVGAGSSGFGRVYGVDADGNLAWKQELGGNRIVQAVLLPLDHGMAIMRELEGREPTAMVHRVLP